MSRKFTRIFSIALRNHAFYLLLSLFFVLGVLSSCKRPDPYLASNPEQPFRLLDHLDQARIVRSIEPVPADDDLFFEFKHSDPPKWKEEGPTARYAVENGLLVWEPEEAATLYSPDNLEIQSEDAHVISIRMRVVGQPFVRLSWKSKRVGKFLHPGRVKIDIPQPNRWYRYDIKTFGLLGWSKILIPVEFAGPSPNVSQLALSVPGKARVEIDFIRVKSRRTYFSGKKVGVTRHSIGNQMRTCLFTHAPSEIEYKLKIPSGGVLSAGLGIIGSDRAIRFSILVRTGKTTHSVLSHWVNSNDTWHDIKIDLEQYAGKEIELLLKSDLREGEATALWSNPTLYRGRTPMESEGSPGGKLDKDQRRVNTILYLIDALRADHLDAYGYGRKTAPNIKRLSQQGVVFTKHFSQNTWTKPSVSTLFSGISAVNHRVYGHGDVLPQSLLTLAESLQKHGFTTAAFVENPHSTAVTGLDRGFDLVDQSCLQDKSDLKASNQASTVDKVIRWLDSHHDESFFLFVHTTEPHAPYAPDKGTVDQWMAPGNEPSPIDLYDGEIIRADRNLGRLLTALDKHALRNNTLLIILSDHGEAFAEHNGMTGHGGIPYNELIHIPLIVRLPNLLPAAKVVSSNTQMMDIAPTILEIQGIPISRQHNGKSLLPLIREEQKDVFQKRTLISEGRRGTAIVKGDWKLILKGRRVELYNISQDAVEQNNLAASKPKIVRSLRRELLNYERRSEESSVLLRNRQTEERLEINPQSIEALRTLGYIE